LQQEKKRRMSKRVVRDLLAVTKERMRNLQKGGEEGGVERGKRVEDKLATIRSTKGKGQV